MRGDGGDDDDEDVEDAVSRDFVYEYVDARSGAVRSMEMKPNG